MFKTDTTQTDWRGNHPIIYLDVIESKDAPMPHHIRGLSWTATGYGLAIPSRLMVRTESAGVWRRVYLAQISNAGTPYVRIKGARVCIRGV